MTTLKYYAYGSNMFCKRFKDRISSAKVIGIGILHNHRLAFHKISEDGSGKCDVVPSESDTVYGIVFEINKKQKTKLDRLEGLGKGYAEKTVVVELMESGETICAVTYYATNIDPKLKPYTWYKKHVLTGATEAKLPPDYITDIKNVQTDKDPDKKREAKELRIYGSCP